MMMNTLMAIFASLLITIPSVAMENKRCLNVTEQENSYFIDHISKAVAFNKRMIAEKKISENNPIHLILDQLYNACAFHGNDVTKLLISNASLREEFFTLKASVESSPTIVQLLNVYKKKDDIIRARLMGSEFKLRVLCPQYEWMSYQTLGEQKFIIICPQYFQDQASDQDRVNFMLKNADYLNAGEEEKKARIEKYIALFLYQTIFARQVD